jgi:hypothetical protein
MLLAPIWAFHRALHTTYLVTSKRAIATTSGIMPHLSSVPLASISVVDARPFADDHGSIVFKETVTKGHEGEEIIHQEGFIAIPKLAHVAHLLRTAVDRLPKCTAA